MKLSDLFLYARVFQEVPGSVRGRCYVCGDETAAGHREVPSEKFTAWSFCYAGSVICERCYPLIKCQRLRTRSWIITLQELQDLSFEALLEPPLPPFAVYLTAGRQRQGWLTLMHAVSYSRDCYFVGTDWTDRPVHICLDRDRPVAELVLALRERKVGTQALLSGDFGVNVWKRALQEGWHSLLQQARELVGSTIYEVFVHASRYRREADRAAGGGLQPHPLAPDADLQEPA